MIAGRLSQENRRTLTLAALFALTVAGVALRTYDLGALSFFGDEETTAFAARSLALGEGSAMPSGMPYRRALPYTWLNAVSARTLGLDQELSYRLPAALLGAATIPLLYFVVRAMATPAAGLIAALLMALSGWHLVWSRTARMYVPALIAAVAFFYFAWRWQRSGRRRELAAAGTLYLLAVFLHSGSAAIALFPLFFSLLYDGRSVSVRRSISATGVMILAGWSLDRLFVVAPYEQWASGFSAMQSAPAGRLLGSLGEAAAGFPPIAWLGLAVGALVGWSWARASGVFSAEHPAPRTLAVALLAGTTVMAGFAGLPLVAGSLGFSALVLDARGARVWWKPGWLATVLAGSAAAILGRLLLAGESIGEIARSPFPYLPYLATLLPVFVGAFVLGAIRLGLVPERPGRDDLPWRAATLYVLAYCLALGVAIPYAPWRYLLPVYPWMVMVVAVTIGNVVEILASRGLRVRRSRLWAGVTLAIVLGLVGGHGVPAAWTVLQASHGTPVPWNDPGMEIRPDHRGPGRFVREHAKPEDIVIAEDALEQRWYAGRVDYWYRSLDDARRYLYRDTDGALRDIYVGAELLAGPPAADLWARREGAVWLITSGETAGSRTWYLAPDQADWLDSLEARTSPLFIGEDGLSAVYCSGRCP
jgi:hypothetical protein